MIRTLFFLSFLLLPAMADAASMYISPATGTYEVGERVTVTVYAESSVSLNAVAGTLNVPSAGFEIISVSYAGSVPNFWVQAPAAVGSTVRFEGAVLNPGYTGSAGKIASVTLRAKSTGSHSLSLSGASILANDGKGTNILTGTRGSTYTVKAATPKPVVPEEPEEEPEVVPEEVPVVEEVVATSAPEVAPTPLPWAPWQLWALVLVLAACVLILLSVIGSSGGSSHDSVRRFIAHSFGVMRKNIKKEESLLRNRHDAAAEREKDLLDTLEENIDTTEKRLEEELSHNDPEKKGE